MQNKQTTSNFKNVPNQFVKIFFENYNGFLDNRI